MVYPSWTKYATNILKNIYILILMAQFHKAPLNFGNLGLGGDRHGLSGPIKETDIGYQDP